jgi:16S rRNA (guanine527-N7)-methyltransferase
MGLSPTPPLDRCVVLTGRIWSNAMKDEQDWLRSPDGWNTTLHWQPTSCQWEQFQALYHQLVQLNQAVNLTRITSPQDFLEKHVWDSLWGIQPWLIDYPESSLRVIDIGTGGGFPGCPVAIAKPHWQVTLLDATHKKMTCLETLCQQLELTNVKPLCDRAETLGRSAQHRNHYDLALIRAVDGATVCAEYALPMLTLEGMAVLYRGQWTVEEEDRLKQALQLLGGEVQEITVTQTPVTQSVRHRILVQKKVSTPADYPRRVGVPSRRPLGL